MIPRNQADLTHTGTIQMSALDCSLPPNLLLYRGRPHQPFLEAEASVLIQPGQNGTWITFEVVKSKYYLYLSQRSSKESIEGFSPKQTWVPSYVLCKTELLA